MSIGSWRQTLHAFYSSALKDVTVTNNLFLPNLVHGVEMLCIVCIATCHAEETGAMGSAVLRGYRLNVAVIHPLLCIAAANHGILTTSSGTTYSECIG